MDRREREAWALALLSAVFAVSLVSANFLSSKLFEIQLPPGLYLIGPAGVVAYSATFLVTDVVSEIYGRRAASAVVKAGFIAQVAAVFYTFVALSSPASPVSPVDEDIYRSVVWAGRNIIIASLIAYLISQMHDVWAFHMWRRLTGGKWLWLRNNASTMVSQLIDTVVFIGMAFWLLPLLLGGDPLPLNVVATIIYSQYLIKIAIAALDTPLVYLAVHATRMYLETGSISFSLSNLKGGFIGRRV